MKKVYEVELKYTSYVVVTVEADSYSEAEDAAWDQLAYKATKPDGMWEVESIEEMEKENDE